MAKIKVRTPQVGLLFGTATMTASAYKMAPAAWVQFYGHSLPLATSQATGGGSGFASFLLGAVNNYA
jgi:hypothetical protein